MHSDSVYCVNTNEKYMPLKTGQAIVITTAHINVHILFYPIKSGEGVLQCIVFCSITRGHVWIIEQVFKTSYNTIHLYRHAVLWLQKYSNTENVIQQGHLLQILAFSMTLVQFFVRWKNPKPQWIFPEILIPTYHKQKYITNPHQTLYICKKKPTTRVLIVYKYE